MALAPVRNDKEIEKTVPALAREPGGILADPGNEILNAKRNCSRYIVLERAATQGAASGEPLLTCGKLIEINVEQTASYQAVSSEFAD